jgi:hypothetical protein
MLPNRLTVRWRFFGPGIILPLILRKYFTFALYGTNDRQHNVVVQAASVIPLGKKTSHYLSDVTSYFRTKQIVKGRVAMPTPKNPRSGPKPYFSARPRAT